MTVNSKWAFSLLYVAYLIALGLFAYYARTVDNFPGEVNASLWIQSHQPTVLDAFMKALSFISDELVAIPILLATAIAIFLKGWRFDSILLAITSVTGFIAMLVTKELVARPRPSEDVVEVFQMSDSFSFPSGSVMLYTVFLGMLAWILIRHLSPSLLLRALLAFIVVILLAIGYSRIYLGAHWAGDVMGGYALGIAVIWGSIWLLKLIKGENYD